MSGIAGITVRGREAVPLRALPFLTGGALDGRILLEFIVRENNLDAYPPLDVSRVDDMGDASPVDPGELHRHLTDMESDRSATREQQRGRIPPGLWVWKDQALVLYSSVARDFAWQHDGRMVGFRGQWCEAPLLTAVEHAYVHEALPETSSPVPAKPSRSKFESNGLDMSLQQAAVDAALELARRSHGRKATRREVAKELAGSRNMPASTIERRICAKWW